MKKFNISLIKELIISILIALSIVLIICIIFYDSISISKIIPESEEYLLTEEMGQDLNTTVKDDTTEIVTTYYIDAAELKKYEQTKEYDKGKKNPFAEESDTSIVDNSVINGNDANITTTNTIIENSTNFYEDKGIK